MLGSSSDLKVLTGSGSFGMPTKLEVLRGNKDLGEITGSTTGVFGVLIFKSDLEEEDSGVGVFVFVSAEDFGASEVEEESAMSF